MRKHDLNEYAVWAFYGTIFAGGRLSTHLYQSEWYTQVVAIVVLMGCALVLTYLQAQREVKARREAVEEYTRQMEELHDSES